MDHKKLLPQMMRLTLFLLLLVACGTSQPTLTPVPLAATLTPVPPTATFTPIPPTATLTPVPPTATFTPLPPTATSTPLPPTATPWPITILVELSKAQWNDPEKPLRLQVIEGKYPLVSGAELWAGSDLDVSEDWLTFPEGLAIDIGADGVVLKGKTYSEGTRLRVDEHGDLIESR